MNRSFFRLLVTFRARFSACNTLCRFCARHVLCRPAFPSAPPFAPPTPSPIAQLCSSASSLLWQGQTPRARSSSAAAPRLPDADHYRPVPLVRREASRFPRKDRLHMPGSSTTPGRSDTRAGAPDRVAFRHLNGVGARNMTSFAAQWLACTLPYRRFATALAVCVARLGADAVRYSFIATDSHRLVLAGLPAHSEEVLSFTVYFCPLGDQYRRPAALGAQRLYVGVPQLQGPLVMLPFGGGGGSL